MGSKCLTLVSIKGKSVSEVLKKEPSFYAWMMDADFPLNTKQVLTKIAKQKSKNRFYT